MRMPAQTIVWPDPTGLLIAFCWSDGSCPGYRVVAFLRRHKLVDDRTRFAAFEAVFVGWLIASAIVDRSLTVPIFFDLIVGGAGWGLRASVTKAATTSSV